MKRKEVIDVLEFKFMEDQDERSFEDQAGLMSEGNQGKHLLKSDAFPSSSPPGASAVQNKMQARRKKAADRTSAWRRS